MGNASVHTRPAGIETGFQPLPPVYGICVATASTIAQRRPQECHKRFTSVVLDYVTAHP